MYNGSDEQPEFVLNDAPGISSPDGAISRSSDLMPASPITRSELAEDPSWTFLDVVLIAIFSIIATGLLTAFVLVGVHAVPSWRHYTIQQLASEPLAVIPPQALGYMATLGFMVLVVRRGTATSFWQAVKWRWPSRPAAYFCIGLALSVVVQLGSNLLPIPKTLPIDQFFRTTHAAWALAVFGVLIAPVFEELFFRGFFYPVLYRRMGFFAAMALNSLLFSFTHEGQLAHAWAPLLILFIVGSVLTVVRAKTQSVACSFLVHSGYNAFLFAMIFFATGGFRHMDRLK